MTATPEPEAKQEPKKHVIHFVDDGFTAFGRVWYTGQEISISEDADEFPSTMTRKSKTDPSQGLVSWLLFDEDEQVKRYGRRIFRQGPWPGDKTFARATFEQIASPPTSMELQSAAEVEATRKGAVT